MTARRTAPPAPRKSALEQEYGIFYDATIATAGDAASLMKDLNQVHTIVTGLGAVLRIVGGNAALADEFAEDDPDSPPPLSRTAEGMLTAMAAAVCEQTRDYLELRSRTYNREVSQ